MFYRLSPSPSVIGSSLYIPMSSLYGAGAGADVGAGAGAGADEGVGML